MMLNFFIATYMWRSLNTLFSPRKIIYLPSREYIISLKNVYFQVWDVFFSHVKFTVKFGIWIRMGSKLLLSMFLSTFCFPNKVPYPSLLCGNHNIIWLSPYYAPTAQKCPTWSWPTTWRKQFVCALEEPYVCLCPSPAGRHQWWPGGRRALSCRAAATLKPLIATPCWWWKRLIATTPENTLWRQRTHLARRLPPSWLKSMVCCFYRYQLCHAEFWRNVYKKMPITKS